MTTLRNLLAFLTTLHPVKVVAGGYASYMLLGWLLLLMPFSHEGEPVSALDNLFIAASAVSTTGLATVSPAGSYNFFGELVILALIQLGGVGYMTAGSFVILAGGKKLSDFRRGVTESAFVLPSGMRVERFVLHVVAFTLAVEAAGAVALFYAFRDAGAPGDTGELVWTAVFHSISAFCTAGFSLYDTSLEAFRGHFWVNAVVSALSLCGAIGFIVLSDAWQVVTGRRERLTLTSRIILHATAWVLGGGWLLLFVGDAGLAELPAEERLLASFFQSMTAMTTVGFNTHPISSLSLASVVLMLGLMVIGASPSGTGGGMKSTTVSATVATIRAALTGRERIAFAGRAIPERRLRTAAATVGTYLLVLAVAVYLLMLTEGPELPFADLVFETFSALGTVGLSRGVTGDLSTLGKLVLIAVMFLGRLGPVSFGVALLARGGTDTAGSEQTGPARSVEAEEEDLAV